MAAKTEEERDRWYAHLVDLSSLPVTDGKTIGGKRWARTREIICPQCGTIFYGYQQEGARYGRNQPEPSDGRSARQTCGHPMCHDAEHDMQFRIRLEQDKLKQAFKPEDQKEKKRRL